MPFIPFTEEQKQQANNVDLPEFLRMRGERLKSVTREYQLIYTDETGKHALFLPGMADKSWADR